MKEKERIEAELNENGITEKKADIEPSKNQIDIADLSEENANDAFLCENDTPDKSDSSNEADDFATDESADEPIEPAAEDSEAEAWRSTVEDVLHSTGAQSTLAESVAVDTVEEFQMKDCTKSPEDEKPSIFGEVIISPDDLFSRSGITIPKSQAQRHVVYEDSDELTGEQISLEEIDTQIPEKQDSVDDVEDEPEVDYEDGELPKYDPEKPRKIDKRFDFIELFIFTLVAVMVITTFFFKHSVVDGRSMEGTLIDGEHLIISDLFYSPSQGDIIVCEDFTTVLKKPIVKRVIATEGQTVKITRQGEIYVNGNLLEEDYVYIDDPTYSYRELEVLVPAGEVFVMGDHRNQSTDSRDIGTISEESILGRVIIRFYPFNKFGKVE